MQETVNKSSPLSSLTTTSRSRDIGVKLGDLVEIEGKESMVYLMPILTSAFSELPYSSRFAFSFVEDEDGEIYGGWCKSGSKREVWVHVAVSEVEYQQEIDRRREDSEEENQDLPEIPFAETQVASAILKVLDNKLWLKNGSSEDEETRPSKYASCVSIGGLLHRLGYKDANEVRREVEARSPMTEMKINPSGSEGNTPPKVLKEWSESAFAPQPKIAQTPKIGKETLRKHTIRTLLPPATNQQGNEVERPVEQRKKFVRTEETRKRMQEAQKRRWEKVRQQKEALVAQENTTPPNEDKGESEVLNSDSGQAKVFKEFVDGLKGTVWPSKRALAQRARRLREKQEKEESFHPVLPTAPEVAPVPIGSRVEPAESSPRHGGNWRWRSAAKPTGVKYRLEISGEGSINLRNPGMKDFSNTCSAGVYILEEVNVKWTLPYCDWFFLEGRSDGLPAQQFWDLTTGSAPEGLKVVIDWIRPT